MIVNSSDCLYDPRSSGRSGGQLLGPAPDEIMSVTLGGRQVHGPCEVLLPLEGW